VDARDGLMILLMIKSVWTPWKYGEGEIGGTPALILNLGTRRELRWPATLLTRKSPPLLIELEAVWVQNPIKSPMLGINLRFLRHPARRLVTMPTELPRFQVLSTHKTKPTQLRRSKEADSNPKSNGRFRSKELQEALNLSYFLWMIIL